VHRDRSCARRRGIRTGSHAARGGCVSVWGGIEVPDSGYSGCGEPRERGAGLPGVSREREGSDLGWTRTFGPTTLRNGGTGGYLCLLSHEHPCREAVWFDGLWGIDSHHINSDLVLGEGGKYFGRDTLHRLLVILIQKPVNNRPKNDLRRGPSKCDTSNDRRNFPQKCYLNGEQEASTELNVLVRLGQRVQCEFLSFRSG
jgi:hypothetical protein